MRNNKTKVKKDKKGKPKETLTDKPKETEGNGYGGMPDRDLKKNLGCG